MRRVLADSLTMHGLHEKIARDRPKNWALDPYQYPLCALSELMAYSFWLICKFCYQIMTV